MKEWFVLQALTGQEQKVQRHLIMQARARGLLEFFDIKAESSKDEDLNESGIVVPTERVTDVKNGKKTVVRRKIYPGYVLAHMALYQDDAKRTINQPVWQFIQETPGVIGFIGGTSLRPRPLTEEEASNILNRTEEAKQEVAKPKIVFQVGETVRITDGPFMSFSGTVDEIDPTRGRLKISVSIFGRTAPVELEYWQVERLLDNPVE